jgi:prepilin-type processing-associated H-X9-DG protein
MKKVFGVTVIEVLVVVMAVVIIASIFYPLGHHHSPGKAKQTTCTSNQRQIAMAAIMYTQDNAGRWPGVYDLKSKKYTGWVKNILPYIKSDPDDNNMKMFFCPEAKGELNVSICYGYNAALLQSEGLGINEKMILQPTQLGVICDADLRQNAGGIVGDANKFMQLTVYPVGRHNNKCVVIGYADGHAAIFYEKNNLEYNINNQEDKVNKAFYRAVELGYIKKAGTKGR